MKLGGFRALPPASYDGINPVLQEGNDDDDDDDDDDDHESLGQFSQPTVSERSGIMGEDDVDDDGDNDDDDDDNDDDPIGKFSQQTVSQMPEVGGGGDGDHDDDDDDDDDDGDDDSDDHGSIDGQTSILDFRLLDSIDEPQIRSYRSLVNVRRSILLLNLESFFYGSFADELTSFLSTEFLKERSVMRVWIHVNVEFNRESDEGLLTTVAPFAQSPFYVPVVVSIGSHVSTVMSSLIEKIDLFLDSGSGWSVSRILSTQVDLIVYGHQFNQIGYGRAATHQKLYGDCGSYHVDNEGGPILKRIIFSICSTDALCFPLAIGAGLVKNVELLTVWTGKTVQEVEEGKKDLVAAAYRQFDFCDIPEYPCSFSSICLFARRNSSKLLLSIYGISKKKVAKGKKGPKDKADCRPYKIWPVFQTENFLKRTLEEPNLPVIHMVVTGEVSVDLDVDRYHVSLVPCFQSLMRAVKRQSKTQVFCPNCLVRVTTNLTQHNELCHSSKADSSEVRTQLEFPQPGWDQRFQMGLGAATQPIWAAMDTETAQVAVEDKMLFGELSECQGSLTPISFSSFFGFNLGVQSLPRLLPKVYVGKDVIANFYEQAMLELSFLQSVLRRTCFPIDMTEAEELLRGIVTHCSNCQRAFVDSAMIHAHHEHTQEKRNFLGYLCFKCNAKVSRLQPGICLIQNLKGFESKMLVSSVTHPKVRKMVERMQVYVKSSDNVSSIYLTFKCVLCNPELLPKARLPFRVFGPNKSTLNDRLDAEFTEMISSIEGRREEERVVDEITPEERAGVDAVIDRFSGLIDDGWGSDEDSEGEEEEEEEGDHLEDDSTDDNAEEGSGEELEGEGGYARGRGGRGSDGGKVLWSSGPTMNEKHAQCIHHPKERTLIIRDSLNFLSASLEKSCKSVQACFQTAECGNLKAPFALTASRCECVECGHLYHLPTDARFMCDFAQDFFNNVQVCNKICLKSIFPYSHLNRVLDEDGEIDEAVLEAPIPEFEFFHNELTDPKASSGQVSRIEYDELIATMSALGIFSFGDLLGFYNVCDTLQVLLCIRTIDKYYFSEFGLSTLRYGSLSSFAYQVLLKGLSSRYGRGVECLSSLEMKTFLSEGIYGGLGSVLKHGGKLTKANGVELPEFDVKAPQRHILPLDVNR